MPAFLWKKARISFLSLAVLALLWPGCSKKDNPVGPDTAAQSTNITTGPTVDAGSTPIGTAGGSITITTPGSPLNGLKLDVPANTYATARTFKISYAPVQSHQLGQNFTLLSPLITVANGGGYSDLPMSMKIPVKVPAGSFAMAFFYDRATGELEGLPLLAADSTSVTIATRHFCSSALSPTGGPGRSGTGLFRGLEDDLSFSNIIVSSIPELWLDVDKPTGFTPGVDDFRFANWGSTIAPGGHCAGQSVGMIWYYNYKKSKGSPDLYSRFDNDGKSPATPNFWQDDVLAYRFCSTLQRDMDFDASGQKLLSWWQNQKPWPVARRTMRLVSYALLSTGKPQLLFISGTDAAHAVVVYRKNQNVLMIADPNKPGNQTPHIDYQNGSGVFDPYWTGTNAGTKDYLFDTFEYAGLTSLIDVSKINSRWAEVANGTIGSDRFPRDTVYVMDESSRFVPLADGFKRTDGKFSLRIAGTVAWPKFLVFDAAGNFLANGAEFQLPQGTHRIGVQVNDNGGSWVNFHWYSVESGKTALDLTTLKSFFAVLTADLRNAAGDKRHVDPIDANVKNSLPDSVKEPFAAITWSGSSFTAAYTYTRTWPSGSKTVTTGSASGAFTTDGSKLNTFQGTQTVESRYPDQLTRRSFSIKFHDLPMSNAYGPLQGVAGTAAALQSVLTSLSYTTYDSSKTSNSFREYDIIDWSKQVYLDVQLSTRTN